jgi:hypothetical protein
VLDIEEHREEEDVDVVIKDDEERDVVGREVVEL